MIRLENSHGRSQEVAHDSPNGQESCASPGPKCTLYLNQLYDRHRQQPAAAGRRESGIQVAECIHCLPKERSLTKPQP